MGQSCIKSQKVEKNQELQCQVEILLPISHSNQIKRPIYEFNQIRGREETKDDVDDLDLETKKSKKKEQRYQYSSKTTFQMGVKQQKQLIKSQLKTMGGDISQIFNKKKSKLIRTDRQIRAQEYNARLISTEKEPRRNGTYSSNRSIDNSQSPLQLSLKQQNQTFESLKDEIKSVRSMKTTNQQPVNHGILKQKKGKAKSMYYKRTVRFQFQ